MKLKLFFEDGTHLVVNKLKPDIFKLCGGVMVTKYKEAGEE